MISITNDGFCPFDLYHGTSSFYLDSIHAHGLGGVDLHCGLRSREALSHLNNFFVCERIELPTMDALVLDRIVTKSSRYQYGDVYVASDIAVAWDYGNREGGLGELVGVIARLLKLAMAAGYVAPGKQFPVFDLIKSPTEAVVLRIRAQPLSSIRYDCGSEVPVGTIQSMFGDPDFQDLHIGELYRIIEPVPWDRIEVVSRMELAQLYAGGMLLDPEP